MKDIEVFEQIKQEYNKNNFYNEISSSIITKELLNNILQKADEYQHFEEVINWYDDENDDTFHTWSDVEGEGYGWLWEKYPESEWPKLIKDKLIKYINKRKDDFKENKYIVIAKNKDFATFHFIDREDNQCDYVYGLSHNEIY